MDCDARGPVVAVNNAPLHARKSKSKSKCVFANAHAHACACLALLCRRERKSKSKNKYAFANHRTSISSVAENAQHEPHWPWGRQRYRQGIQRPYTARLLHTWSFTGVTAPFARQSTTDGAATPARGFTHVPCARVVFDRS